MGECVDVSGDVERKEMARHEFTSERGYLHVARNMDTHLFNVSYPPFPPSLLPPRFPPFPPPLGLTDATSNQHTVLSP